VDASEARALKESKGVAGFFEISSKTGEGVETSMNEVLTLLLKFHEGH